MEGAVEKAKTAAAEMPDIKELDKAATLGTVINRKSFPTARKLLAYQLRKLRQGGAAGRNLAGSLSKNPEAAAVGGVGALIPGPAPTGTASLVAYLALKKKLLTIMSKTGAAKAEKAPWRVEKSDIHGKGLFAIRDIPTGGHVTHTANLEDDEGLGRWELSEAARYTNHSPDPNTRATSDGQKMTMVAASPIKKGDEITVSYFQVASTTGAGARITHKGKPMCSVGAGELRKWVGSAPEEEQATIMSKTGAATLAKVAQGAWRPTAAQLYRAVASAETGGEPDPWIRTKYREAPGGSTAYGPVQLTRTTAEGYQTKYPQFFTAPQLAYLEKYKQQGKQFAYHGNMEGKVPDFNAQYDYGGTGSLTNAADKTMYGEVAQRMLAHHQQTTPNTLKAVERWRGVPPGKDKRYYRAVQRSLDAQRSAPVAAKPAPPVAPTNTPPAAPMNAPPFKGGSAEFKEKQATIKQKGDKWLLYSHKGKVLGTHDSEEKARKQEQAIQISKHAEHKVAFTMWPRWSERADRKGLKDIFSAGEDVDTDARKTLIDSVMQHRRNPTVPTGSTVLTRSHIEGDKLSPEKLKGMGFLPSYIAVPERGQKSFRTWRHPETEIHLHQHPKNWLFHEDKWPSLAMARIKAKRRAASSPPRSGVQKLRDRWNLLRGSVPHVAYEGIPGYLNYASGLVMNKPRFAIPGEPVHTGSSALGQVGRVAGLSALLGGLTSGGDTHRFARNAARVAGTFAGIEGGQRLHKALSERYAAVRHPGLLALMIQLGMPIAGAVGADAIAKRLVPKKEEEETDKAGSIQASKHAEHVDPDWQCPECGKKLGDTASKAVKDGKHHYHPFCRPKKEKVGSVIPQTVLQAIYSRNRAALSAFGRRGAARKAAIRAAEKRRLEGTPQEPLNDLLARVKKQIPLEAKRDPHIIHTTIKDGQVRVDSGRFLEKHAVLPDELLVPIGMGAGAAAIYKGLSRIDDTVNFNDKTFLRNLRRQMGASPDLDIALGSSSYYYPTKRQIKIEGLSGFLPGHGPPSGPVTVRKGAVAHELGHATGKHFPGGFHRGGLVKYLPLIGLVGTGSRDENTARLSALGGTAISIPTIGEEIRASRRGAKALKALQGGKKMRFGGRMGPYAGLITYLAAAGIPLAAYGVNKRKGYYRPAKKSAQAIKEGAVSLQIVAEDRQVPIQVELANTPEKRATGLSGRAELPPGHGMFFDKAGSYWMKDVEFPLDLLFLDKSGQVLEIHHMPDDDPHTIYRPGNKEAEHAIELAAGWFDKQGFKVGDKVVVHTGVEALDNT
jgi:uncharacterized membrane protein (UPF0127 family)